MRSLNYLETAYRSLAHKHVIASVGTTLTRSTFDDLVTREVVRLREVHDPCVHRLEEWIKQRRLFNGPDLRKLAKGTRNITRELNNRHDPVFAILALAQTPASWRSMLLCIAHIQDLAAEIELLESVKPELTDERFYIDDLLSTQLGPYRSRPQR